MPSRFELLWKLQILLRPVFKMSESPTFRIVTLPKGREWSETDETALAIAQKFREFRLHALQTAPEAFATSYENESRRGLDHTFERLRNAKAAHFFALANDAPESTFMDDVDRLSKGKLVGQLVLLGPQDGGSGPSVSARTDPFARMTTTVEAVSSGHGPSGPQETPVMHFHLNGVFVDPSARRGGLGKALIDIALLRAEAEANKVSAVPHVSISVNEENPSARKLYEKAGFKVVGEETYIQQPRMIMGESRSSEKVALQMELSMAAVQQVCL